MRFKIKKACKVVTDEIHAGENFKNAVINLMARQIINADSSDTELVLYEYGEPVSARAIGEVAARIDRSEIIERIRFFCPDRAEAIIAEAWPE